MEAPGETSLRLGEVVGWLKRYQPFEGCPHNEPRVEELEQESKSVDVQQQADQLGAGRASGVEVRQGLSGGGGGGGARGLGLVGSPMGVAVDLFAGWKNHTGSIDLKAASEALAPCQEVGPRDPHREIEYTVVVALDARRVVTRAEHQSLDRPPTGQSTCILERIRGLRFPPGAQRAVVLVNDGAPEPIPRTAKSLLNFELDSEVGLINRSPFYHEPRFHRCVLPLGKTPFALKLDETGRVLEAQVPGLEGEVRTCAEDALRHVAFTCPEGGPTTVEGRMVVVDS